MRDLLIASAALLPPGPHRDAILRQVPKPLKSPPTVIDETITDALERGAFQVSIPWAALSGCTSDCLPRLGWRFETERGDGFWSYRVEEIELEASGITLDVTGTWEAPSPDAGCE